MVVVAFRVDTLPPYRARDPTVRNKSRPWRNSRRVTHSRHVWLALGDDAVADAGEIAADDEAVVEKTILDPDGRSCTCAMLLTDVAQS